MSESFLKSYINGMFMCVNGKNAIDRLKYVPALVENGHLYNVNKSVCYGAVPGVADKVLIADYIFDQRRISVNTLRAINEDIIEYLNLDTKVVVKTEEVEEVEEVEENSIELQIQALLDEGYFKKAKKLLKEIEDSELKKQLKKQLKKVKKGGEDE